MSLEKFDTQFYGDNVRYFVGIVINNNDPDFLGRVQVRIFGVHDDPIAVPNSDLPWAQCVVPSTEGGVSGQGFKPNIQTGATVFGFFWDGRTSQLPCVIGSIPKVQSPNNGHLYNSGANSSAGSYYPYDQGYAPSISQVSLTPLRGGGAEEQAFNFFIEKGYTPEQSAGIVGNLIAESNMNTGARNAGDGRDGSDSIGIAQWNSARAEGLKRFAARTGRPWSDLTVQLEYVVEEFRTTERGAGTRIRTAASPQEAADVIRKYYERPLETAQTVRTRRENAQRVFQSFS